MKHTLLLCLLLACSFNSNAQLLTVYDSAINYHMSPSFYAAMDTLIAQAAITADTGESPAYILTRQKYFMSDRISLDVAPGADMSGTL